MGDFSMKPLLALAIGALTTTTTIAQDAFEPDDTPVQATFLEGFDFLTNGPVVIEQEHTFSDASDVDFTTFATTFNYPTSWSGSDPNTRLYLQVCDGACDDVADLFISLELFDFDLIADPANATPVFAINPCPGGISDEQERELPNFPQDETLFVRVTECSGNGAGRPYRLLLTRDAVGIDLHKISGTVGFLDGSSQLQPAPAFVVITSNYNDFTFANPVTGAYALGVLSRDFQSGADIADLELTAQVFGNDQDFDIQTQAVTGLTAADEQIVNFQLNIFLNGFE